MAMNEEFKSQLIGATIQWQKGEKTGRLNKIQDIRMDGAFEYFFFSDGTKEMSVKFPDWFIPINDESSAPLPIVSDENKPQINPIVEQPVININTDITTSQVKTAQSEVSNDPLLILLDKQKKEKRELKFSLNLEIPNPASMKILQDSFDHFDDAFLQWLKNDPNIFESIIQEIKNKIIK